MPAYIHGWREDTTMGEVTESQVVVRVQYERSRLVGIIVAHQFDAPTRWGKLNYVNFGPKLGEFNIFIKK